MSHTKQHTPVVERIKRDFGMDVVPFFDNCIANGFSAKEIASMVNCSLSNIRRVASQFDFSFFIHEPTPMLKDCSTFQNNKMNAKNYLSRRWVA